MNKEFIYYMDCDNDIWRHEKPSNVWSLYNKRKRKWSACLDDMSVKIYINGDLDKPGARKVKEEDLFLEFI